MFTKRNQVDKYIIQYKRSESNEDLKLKNKKIVYEEEEEEVVRKFKMFN